MTEKDVKNCWDELTIFFYKCLKNIYWKDYALQSMQEAPIFNK